MRSHGRERQSITFAGTVKRILEDRSKSILGINCSLCVYWIFVFSVSVGVSRISMSVLLDRRS
jgi:hypothetical protein